MVPGSLAATAAATDEDEVEDKDEDEDDNGGTCLGRLNAFSTPPAASRSTLSAVALTSTVLRLVMPTMAAVASDWSSDRPP